jgi:tRNA G46 methylase TrmB
MEETKVKVTIEVNGEEKKVMEGDGAVVSVFTKDEKQTRIDEVAFEVDPASMALYMRTARDKKMENGKSLMHDAMKVLRMMDSPFEKIRRFFTKP